MPVLKLILGSKENSTIDANVEHRGLMLVYLL